ncbi:MAG: thioredoxin-disulfide reductase [Alphaproteobacteria bacterium]
MSKTHHSKLLIIGSGPAGYTAAIYGARANLEPTLVAGLQPGGQLTITTDVENYPGFAEVIQGPWLMEQMKGQAEAVGTKMVNDMIREVDFNSRPMKAIGDGGDIYTADSIVIATGAQARWLGLESEQKFMGYGVSACATCDAPFYRGRKVMVVGGGNTAVEEALHLTHFADEVVLVHRRDSLRAEKIMQERLFANEKVRIEWNTVLADVTGEGTPPLPEVVTGAVLKDIASGETREEAVDGIFIAIGHDPATKIFRGHVDMDDEGYIDTGPDSTVTSIPGVFAAGDVTDKIYRQAVTAAGMGCMAALEAEKYLANIQAPSATAQVAAE